MFGWFKHKPTLPLVPPSTAATVPRQGSTTMSVMGPAGQSVGISISAAEIAARVEPHSFVLATDPSALKTADQWWEEEAHKRHRREGSDKAYAWLTPFVPLDIAKLEPLQRAQEWGPPGAANIAKELRALIRERRNAKQDHAALLLALYGVCALDDFAASLKFEGMPVHALTKFVGLNELQAIQCEYGTMGYQCSNALAKTDVKWLTEAFGEPAEHQSFDAVHPQVRRNAISRYCWAELRSSNVACQDLGIPQKTMSEWLGELVTRNIGYTKEWEQRVASRSAQVAEAVAGLDIAWAATREPFVVADLETTGLSAATDEILEFAAVLVETDGTITAEFSTLVRVTRPVPAVITKLTGISQADADRDGQLLPDAMGQFVAFVGARPVFFHNAPFDAGFLRQASAKTKKQFRNAVHDTLLMARTVWPDLGSYKLSVLAEHVGVPAPTHRGIADVKATLAVLLAARLKD